MALSTRSALGPPASILACLFPSFSVSGSLWVSFYLSPLLSVHISIWSLCLPPPMLDSALSHSPYSSSPLPCPNPSPVYPTDHLRSPCHLMVSKMLTFLSKTHLAVPRILHAHHVMLYILKYDSGDEIRVIVFPFPFNHLKYP